MYHVKCLRNDSVRFTRHYINGLLLLLLLYEIMNVHWKIKLIESKAEAYGLPLWHYIPCGYLVIKYNMYFYNMNLWTMLKIYFT